MTKWRLGFIHQELIESWKFDILDQIEARPEYG